MFKSNSKIGPVCVKFENPNWRGRLSTVDILALTSLHKLLLRLQALFTFLENKIH